MSDMIQLVAQLMVDVGRRDSQIQRALQVLQRAQRYDLACYPTGAVLERCTHGDYIDADDVSKAIDILQEGQT